MRTIVSQSIIVCAGFLIGPTAMQSVETKDVNEVKSDPRYILLNEFLTDRACPIARHTADFIIAADRNDLDWRLLPSISIIESGGGKDYRNNNVLGWDSCRTRFPSIQEGIHLVASHLANSKLYRHKPLEDMLRTYNAANPNYAVKVKQVMRSISPVEHPIRLVPN
jgi:hypothetical protein